MTRTRRIYNKRPVEGGPGFKGWVTTETGDPSIKYHKYVLKSELFDLDKRRYITKENLCDSPPFFSSYHPYDSNLCFGHCKRCKDLMVSKRRRLSGKRYLRYITERESDTYYFMWNWGYRDVQEGLFGEFLAEKEMNNGIPVMRKMFIYGYEYVHSTPKRQKNMKAGDGAKNDEGLSVSDVSNRRPTI